MFLDSLFWVNVFPIQCSFELMLLYSMFTIWMTSPPPSTMLRCFRYFLLIAHFSFYMKFGFSLSGQTKQHPIRILTEMELNRLICGKFISTHSWVFSSWNVCVRLYLLGYSFISFHEICKLEKKMSVGYIFC